MIYYTGGVYKEKMGDINTKTELKRLVKEAPETVRFDCNSEFGKWAGPITEMPEEDRLQITGPHPEHQRLWYATIERRGDTIKVS